MAIHSVRTTCNHCSEYSRYVYQDGASFCYSCCTAERVDSSELYEFYNEFIDDDE